MNDLKTQVKSYLSTLGYAFPMERKDLVVADRIGTGALRETWVLWIYEENEDLEDRGQLERKFLAGFHEMGRKYPDAHLWLISWTFGGFSKEFLDMCGELRVNRRVPIQFFDMQFKHEQSSESYSAIKELLQFSTVSRIRQPFEIDSSGDGSTEGDDLLEHMWDRYRKGAEPGISIVLGPAGVGKTWLFRSLFSRLYDNFQREKQRLESFPRPIPLIPEYVHQSGALRTRDVLQSFIDSEVASPVGQTTFEWMLSNTYATWLFDGLDELYAEDEDFFLGLAELLTRQGSKANILVCARESLLASCEPFSQFMEDFRDDPHIKVYKLKSWGRESKRQYARLYLDPPEDNGFLAYISSSQTLSDLSDLPFYCDLLRQNYEDGDRREFQDEFDLMEFIVSRMIEREREKGLIREDAFLGDGLFEWLEAIASDFYASNLSGVRQEDVRTYAQTVLSPHLTEDELSDAVTGLVQFPFFSKGSDKAILKFEHELVAEYLAAKYYADRISGYTDRVMRDIGERADFAQSLLAKFMARRIMRSEDGVSRLVSTLRTKPPAGRRFSTLLQLLLLADISTNALEPLGASLEGQDLSNVLLENRNLDGVSFRNCILTGTTFKGCSLRQAKFEGARFSETSFEDLKHTSLEKAGFGDLGRFDSAIVSGKRVESRVEFGEWALRLTGQVGEITDPCPSAKQMWTLFQKYVHATGQGRRDELPYSALVRGKKHADAPPPSEFVDASLSAGYLAETRFRERIRRASGDRYSEIVDFVSEWRVSSGLRKILDDLCDIPECQHVP